MPTFKYNKSKVKMNMVIYVSNQCRWTFLEKKHKQNKHKSYFLRVILLGSDLYIYYQSKTNLFFW